MDFNEAKTILENATNDAKINGQECVILTLEVVETLLKGLKDYEHKQG